MKRFIFVNIFLIVTILSISAKKFTFKFPDGGKQRIEATINGTYTISDNTNTIVDTTDYSQKYTTIRTFKNSNETTSDIIDEDYYYSTNRSFYNTLQELTDTKKNTYVKDIFGKLFIDYKAKFPTYRDVPIFPDKDLSQGESWENEAMEVQDLFNDESIIILPLKVQYVYIGEEKKNDKVVSKFNYIIKIDKKNKLYKDYFPKTPIDEMIEMDPRILRVLGESKTTMFFDNDIGSRIEEDYERDYYFLYTNNGMLGVINFKDSGKRIWHPIELMKKENVVKDIKKDLEKLDNTNVEEDEKGIKISLENIRFYPDSTELLPGEEERLNTISDILKKYKDRGIMVIGHTTDKGTPRGRKILSINRAKKILEYLKNLNAVNPEKSSYTGMGGDKPIASNDTEEGMAKNRRVEIYILED